MRQIRVSAKALEIGSQVAGVLIPKVAVLLQRLVEDLFETLWNLRVETDRGDRILVQDRVEDQGRCVATESPLAGGDLIENQAEREDVGAVVELFASRLLR